MAAKINPPTSLLEQVASVQNLNAAWRECSRGKRTKAGYQKFLFRRGERLVGLRKQLLDGTFCWKGYREFVVKDPKARVIMAAPFSDRVVHHAIHRVLVPILDPHMSNASFACRRRRGTSGAVVALFKHLQTLGERRYVVKLDVEKFFASISHEILLKQLFGGFSDAEKEHFIGALNDQSLLPLVSELVCKSHPILGALEKGIPIGNLTSQLFANWTLTPADHFIEKNYPQVRHFRYMDDLVIVATQKKDALDCAHATVDFVRKALALEIPFSKFIPLAADPVPFLGYVLNHDGYRILARNRRRFAKHLRRLQRRGCRDSLVARSVESHRAWACVPERVKPKVW